MPLHPDLEDLRAQFSAIEDDATRLLEGVSDAQFNWRPAPGQWSIGECLAHLNVVDGADLDPLARAVIDARAKGLTATGPFRYSRLAAWFVTKMEPPAKMKVKAPALYQPRPDQSASTVIAEFQRIHARLGEIVAMADGLDLARVKVPTPIAQWIRFSLTPRLRLLAAHDRRHLWQAHEVRRHPSFPLP